MAYKQNFPKQPKITPKNRIEINKNLKKNSMKNHWERYPKTYDNEQGQWHQTTISRPTQKKNVMLTCFMYGNIISPRYHYKGKKKHGCFRTKEDEFGESFLLLYFLWPNWEYDPNLSCWCVFFFAFFKSNFLWKTQRVLKKRISFLIHLLPSLSIKEILVVKSYEKKLFFF